MTFNNVNQTEDARGEELPEAVQIAWSDSESPSTAVVEAVASAIGRDPLEMSCLYDALDVEALDRLLTSDQAEARGNVSVSFRYDGMYVWIDSGGAIEIDRDPANAK